MRKLFFLTVWAMLLCLQSLKAQTTDVVGKVTDANGNPIPGISVIEKGTRTGTTTASDGSFALKVKPNAVLVFSVVVF